MALSLARAFVPLLQPKRFKVYYGGRGAAKSMAFAAVLVLDCHRSGCKVLCAREYQNSMDDSVYSLIVDQIYQQGLERYFDIQATAIYHRLNGGCFRFIGLARNIQSIKSKFGYNRCWVEEAETISEKSWRYLIPTLRLEDSEVWVSFNPEEEDSATFKLFIKPFAHELTESGVYEDSEYYVRKVSWRDNPWFPEVLRAEMERDKARNLKRYLHIWEGELFAEYEDSVIEPEWVEAAIDAHLKLGIKPRGERVIGFDPADSGKDAKAICKRQGVVVEDVYGWTDGDVSEAIGRLWQASWDYRADLIVFDSLGVGAAVKVGLQEHIGNRKMLVNGFDAGGSPFGAYSGRPAKDVFRNKRAQFWWVLRDRFEATYRAVVKGEYVDPDTIISLSSTMPQLAKLKAELIRQQRKRGGGSTIIQLISKDEMRAKGVPSPNLADALMMSFDVGLYNATVDAPKVAPPIPKHFFGR